MSDEHEDYGGMVPCDKCGKKGYFKYNLCSNCRESCKVCGAKIIKAPAGTVVHPKCLKKERAYSDGESSSDYVFKVDGLFAAAFPPPNEKLKADRKKKTEQKAKA